MKRYVKLKKKIDNSTYTVIACILVWILGNCCMESVFGQDKAMGIVIVFLLFVFYFLFVYRSRKDEENALCHLVLLFGFLVRVIYIETVPYDVSSHDIRTLQNTDEITAGHLGYISYIYHHGEIPNIDPRLYWAYYNPPLYHIISAIWLKFNTTLGIEWNQAAENLQIMTLLYSSMSVVVFEKILDEVDIKGKIKILLLGFWGTFPTLIWLSGNLATDSLVLLWAFLIMLYTIRWYKKRDSKTIIILALCIGFGMITKISLGLFAISVGAVFALGLIETVRKDRHAVKKCVIQFLIFLLICAPIGLSWTIRNSIKFGMEADYVPEGGKESGQYIGDVEWYNRLGIPSAEQRDYAKIRKRFIVGI